MRWLKLDKMHGNCLIHLKSDKIMSAMRSICIAYILQIEAKYIIQLIIILSFIYCDRLCRSHIIYLFDSID